MTTYKLTLEIDDWADVHGDALTLENKMIDLVKAAVLPTLDVNLITYQVTRKRG
jgi:hypothetical protein